MFVCWSNIFFMKLGLLIEIWRFYLVDGRLIYLKIYIYIDVFN